MKMGKIIKDLRLQNHMTQTELAKKAGYTSRSTLARIEAGEIDLPYSKILLFAEIFDVNPVELFGFDEEEEKEREANHLFHKLSDEQKDAFLALLRTTAKEDH